MSFVIKTNKGDIVPFIGHYNGVFQNDGIACRSTQCQYTYPQTITILYGYDNDAFLGNFNLSNNTSSVLISRDQAYNVTFTIGNTITNYSYTTNPNSAGRFCFLTAIFDNDDKVLICLNRSATFFPTEFTGVVLPFGDNFGSGIILNAVWQLDYYYYHEVNEWLMTETPSDPYNPGGETEGEIGGEGDFDNTSDPIPEASLPTLSAVDAKFISLYTPTLAELQSLASYMWSSLFDLDTLKKLFADPMKVILGLSIVPFAVPSSGQQAITIGNIPTGVNMTKASAQYVQIDCGTLNVNEYWGAYLDYSPYTKLEIYLPYIGTKQISVDDVMNKACHVYYNIDILTGACCAMIKCDDSVLYSYAGQCATSIPITGSDWTNVVSGAISIALTAATYHAAGKISPNTRVDTLRAVSSIADDVMQMKPTIDRTGSIAGSAGMLGVQTPYLILTRPRQALPKNQNHYTGYPSFVNVKLGDLTGMTFVEQVHLENVPCTSSEQSEIETLLKGGVIF